MANDRTIPPKKTLLELKNAAIAELERRGYEVRGKNTTQIRQTLKRRPTRLPPTHQSRETT